MAVGAHVTSIQAALAAQGLDGWLFYDVFVRDPAAYRILGLPEGAHVSRRWFYWIPARGEPAGLVHRVEARRLEGLPGRIEPYLGWRELHDHLARLLAGCRTVAMQYSPDAAVPVVGAVDAGTVELVRRVSGATVVSSADLVGRFEAHVDEAGFATHRRAGEVVHRVIGEAFARVGDAVRRGDALTEHGLQTWMLGRLEAAGLTTDGDAPIVGVNDHPADPHFSPSPTCVRPIARGDTLLLDVWARCREPGAVYHDVTWCGFVGTEPPRRYVEIFDVVRRARDAALGLVRERFAGEGGLRGFEVDAAARAVVTGAGYGDSFIHRTGHSIGTRVHGAGANLDDLETRDLRPILPGSCFSIEPGIYLPGEMAVRTELDVCVSDDGLVTVEGPIQDCLVLVEV